MKKKRKEERREQPNQKSYPSMITSTKIYTKKQTKTRKQKTDRTLGQMAKAKLYR